MPAPPLNIYSEPRRANERRALLTLNVPLGRMSWLLAVPVLVLMGLGITAIAAVDPSQAARQALFAATGLVLLLLMTLPNYERLGKYSYLIFVITIALLIITYLLPGSIAPIIKGSRRWIRIPGVGFQLQPSEFAKVAFVLALAWYLRWRRNYRQLSGLIIPAVISLIPVALILKQPDLGTALLFIPAMLLMLFAAGAKLTHFVAVLIFSLGAVPVAWFHIHDYQRLRIVGTLLQSEYVREQIRTDDAWREWLYPYRDRSIDAYKLNEGYQLNQSLIALGSGGPKGQGFAEGIYTQFDYLPERHNDFILAIIGHQWGILGSLTVVVCYAVIALTGLDIATRTNDPFGRLLVVGLVGMIMIQAVLNMGMVVGILPITGTALPFVSAGGSSMWANCIIIGLIQNICVHRPLIMVKRVFAFEP